MPWSPHIPQGRESAKIWPYVIPYARGRGLDIGCGVETCLPHMIGVDTNGLAAVRAKADDLEWVASASLDFIFSSHMLEHIPRESVPDLLDNWGGKLKEGGHLILYLPNSDDYPKVGEVGANPDHKWNIYRDSILHILEGSWWGWDMIENEVRSEYNEYSLFHVFRKTWGAPGNERLWQRNPSGKQRALIIRLGAIGDCIVAASPAKALRDKGYHVTMITSAEGETVLEGNPYIDELITADKDMFPPNSMIAFGEHMKTRYDFVANLDRSLEGLLLQREEGYGFEYPVDCRRWLYGDKSYYDAAHFICDVPDAPFETAFFPTPEEEAWAQKGVDSMAGQGPVVMWQIAGSAFFKIYPWINVVAGWLAAQNVNVIFTGSGKVAATLEQAIVEQVAEDCGEDAIKRLYPRVGHWPLRKSMTFARRADCLVGPETGIMHSAAFCDVPKVVYLSHSSPTNLVKGWRNTVALEPNEERCPCYPCHQIHTVRETCNFDEEQQVARCASSISPQRLFEAIMVALAKD